MKIEIKFMTKNDCYKLNQKITEVKYLIVHSTASKGVMAPEWFDRWNKSYNAGEINRQVAVHAFVDDQIVMQYLPWKMRAWHLGNDYGNDYSIGIEMCEDLLWTESYFLKAKKNMVELYAMLSIKYNVPVDKIIGHYEAYKLGFGSNHADPAHWWKKFNYTMDDFRLEVAKELKIMEVLKYGMTGSAVKLLQENLKKLGYNIVADGSFGPATLYAVKTFQENNKLEVDGIVGPDTQAKIKELLTLPEIPPIIIPPVEKLWSCTVEIYNLTFEQAKKYKNDHPTCKITIV